MANVQTTFAFVYQFEVAGSFPIGGDIVIYEPMVVLSIVLARRSGCILGRSDARRLHTLGLGLLLRCVGVAAYIPLFDERVPLWLLLIPRVIIGWSNSMTGPLASLTSYSLPHAPRPREPHTKPG